MFADCLDLDDINTLVRTTRALNQLLTPYMYRRAKDLRSRNPNRWPYFLWAVDAGNLTAVRHFIDVGTSVNMSYPADQLDTTALHICVRKGYVEMTRLLIQHSVNMSPVNNFGHTPLYEAISKKSEETWGKLLVDAGADICPRTADGETILSWATTCGKLSTVQFLFERGAIPTTRNYRGNTLLHNARQLAEARKTRTLVGGRTEYRSDKQFGRNAAPLRRKVR
jgi:ankyrin repeat protein